MRRHCKKRIFILFSAYLIFYISCYLFLSISRFIRNPNEEIAYLNGLSGSSPMVHNVELCSPNDIDLIIIIISSDSHFLERQSIRETWGSMSRMMNIRSQRLFVVGYRYGNSMFQELSNEAQYEHDLLYLTVNDDSMTLKELYAYKWLEKYCPNVTYTFKTNDDLFVNSFLLHDLIRELKTNPDQLQNRYLYNNSLESLFIAHNDPAANKFLFGSPLYPAKPIRNKASVHYVSYEEYPEDSYPRFCSSLCFLF